MLVSALGKKKATFASSVDVPVGELNSTCLRISFNHKSPHFSLKQKHLNCQSGRQHVSTYSNLLCSIKTSTLNTLFWREIWDEETSNASNF